MCAGLLIADPLLYPAELRGLINYNKLQKTHIKRPWPKREPKLILACLGLMNLMSNTTNSFLSQQVFAL